MSKVFVLFYWPWKSFCWCILTHCLWDCSLYSKQTFENLNHRSGLCILLHIQTSLSSFLLQTKFLGTSLIMCSQEVWNIKHGLHMCMDSGFIQKFAKWFLTVVWKASHCYGFILLGKRTLLKFCNFLKLPEVIFWGYHSSVTGAIYTEYCANGLISTSGIQKLCVIWHQRFCICESKWKVMPMAWVPESVKSLIIEWVSYVKSKYHSDQSEYFQQQSHTTEEKVKPIT